MRDFDVVVFGATSITGRRVAAYLDTVGASWAAAGRDADRVVATLRAEGVTIDRDAVLVASIDDPDSLRAMAARTKVVLNLVGPYTLHGEPVIAACIAAGASYVDLTGETPFVRRMIDRYDGPAQDAGVKVVQVCGFESLPPDLGVRLAIEAAGDAVTDVELVVEVLRQPAGRPRASDMVSGGTIQSMVEASTGEGAAALRDPAGLLDDLARAEQVRALSPIGVLPRRSASGAVLAPMAPAPVINPPVLHRTAALLGAEPFRYREGMALAGGAATLPLRYAAAGALAAAMVPLMHVGRAPLAVRAPAGKVLRRVLPGAGFGPAADRVEDWRWRMTVTAGEATVVIDGHGHPGYLTTARMLGEAGLLLAEDGTTPDRAGHLTPAVALGTAHVDRFARAGLRFTTDS